MKRQQGFAVIPLIISIAIAVAAGYFLFTKKIEVTLPVPTSTPTNAATASPKISDKFIVPSVPQLSKSPPPIQTDCNGVIGGHVYSDDEFGFQVRYPNNWQSSGNKYSNAFEILNYAPTNAQNIPRQQQARISFGPSEKRQNLADAIQGQRYMWYSHRNDKNFHMEFFEIEGRPAAYFAYQWRPQYLLGVPITPGGSSPVGVDVDTYIATLAVVDDSNLIILSGQAWADSNQITFSIFCQIESILKSVSFYNQEKSLAILKGHADIGPICPVQSLTSPCPVPASAYASRGVIVYKTDFKTVVTKVYFDPDGNYLLKLPPGSYIVDNIKTGIDFGKDLPKEITLSAGQTLRLDISIDTGIR